MVGSSAFHSQFSRFFRSMDVALMPFPLADMNEVEKLSSMTADQLAPKYVEAVKMLKGTVTKELRNKMVGKMTLDGKMLAELMEIWVSRNLRFARVEPPCLNPGCCDDELGRAHI